MKVLICDDAGFIRQILREIITGAEVTIFEASNGKQAIEMASSVKPDLVFLDIVLPYKNGVEVATVLKAQDPTVKIIGISTLDKSQIEAIHQTEGLFSVFIEKPFNKQDIQNAIGGV